MAQVPASRAPTSATALCGRRELDQGGVEIETVETDFARIPESLHGRFDLVYVTVGAICWIDDLDRWSGRCRWHARRAPGHGRDPPASTR